MHYEEDMLEIIYLSSTFMIIFSYNYFRYKAMIIIARIILTLFFGRFCKKYIVK